MSKLFIFAFGLVALAMASETAPTPRLSDDFQRLVGTEFRALPHPSYEVRVWSRDVVTGKFHEAGHLWGTIRGQIPSSFEPLAEAGNLYVLWRLKLPQTFFSQWMFLLGRPSYVSSPAEKVLEKILAPQLPRLLEAEAIRLTGRDAQIATQLPDRPVFETLRAWSALRRTDAARSVLSKLRPGSPWRLELAKTAALGMVRRGDVDGAIRFLRSLQLGPRDVPSGASYALTLARLLFQQGDLEGAQSLYESVDEKSPDYLIAREELLWIWLRTGNVARLRGDLTTFRFEGRALELSPEFYVVRAISDLKLCLYDEVKRDVDNFIRAGSTSASEIEGALKQEAPPRPTAPDWYSRLAERATQRRRVELAALDSLAQESITAPLPTVGQQATWKNDSSALSSEIARLEQLKSREYLRQWRSHQAALTEAIRKMRFVKVELLSQFSQGLKARPDSLVSQGARGKAMAEIQKEGEGRMSFPFDGFLWPDELFKERGAIAGQCL